MINLQAADLMVAMAIDTGEMPVYTEYTHHEMVTTVSDWMWSEAFQAGYHGPSRSSGMAFGAEYSRMWKVSDAIYMAQHGKRRLEINENLYIDIFDDE